MNMGKEKIEEKDVRLLRYAVEQAFDGAMRDGALALLNRLVDLGCRALWFGCGQQRRVWKSFRQRASFRQRKIPTEISTNFLLIF